MSNKLTKSRQADSDDSFDLEQIIDGLKALAENQKSVMDAQMAYQERILKMQQDHQNRLDSRRYYFGKRVIAARLEFIRRLGWLLPITVIAFLIMIAGILYVALNKGDFQSAYGIIEKVILLIALLLAGAKVENMARNFLNPAAKNEKKETEEK